MYTLYQDKACKILNMDNKEINILNKLPPTNELLNYNQVSLLRMPVLLFLTNKLCDYGILAFYFVAY